jgi:uncharacterized protein (DUF736 family)
MAEDTDTDDEPTFFVAGEPVRIRGASFGTVEDAGRKYSDISLHVQFPEMGKTTEVHLSMLKVEGGLSTIYQHLRDRGMLPRWVTHGNQIPPWDDPDADLDGDGPHY